MRFALPLSFLAALLCLTPRLAAQSRNPDDLAVGKLLVAPREALDPSFANTVILLVQFDQDAVVGLIVNRRSKVPISRALHQLQGAANRSDLVYLGGPVNLAAVFALLHTPTKPDDARRVVDNIFLLSDRLLLENTLASGAGPAGFRTYVGYCGWARGQLEHEMNLGAWYIFDGSSKLVFDSDPDTLWSRLVARTEQKYARR